MLKRLFREEEGQDVIEWGFLAAFLGIALLAGLAFTNVDTTVSGWYTDVVNTITQ